MAPRGRKRIPIQRTPREDGQSERPDPMREVEMLREELQQLRTQLQEQPQNPPAQESIRSNIGRKPEPFRGTKAEKDSFRIKHWLDRMDTYWRTSGVT